MKKSYQAYVARNLHYINLYVDILITYLETYLSSMANLGPTLVVYNINLANLLGKLKTLHCPHPSPI